MAEDFFVGVYDPVDVRRNLLEGSKELVQSLQSHDALHRIRIQKLKHIREMNTVMQELEMLVKRLKNKLPETHLRKALSTQKRPRRVVPEQTEIVDKLGLLEKELRNIEESLSKFN